MKNKITRSEIAKTIGISKGAFSDLANGKRPIGKPTAKKLSAMLGLSLGQIIDMKGPMIEAMLKSSLEAKETKK